MAFQKTILEESFMAGETRQYMVNALNFVFVPFPYLVYVQMEQKDIVIYFPFFAILLNDLTTELML